ncbi:Uncharacterised protein [Legionella cincinnatiensis]|uniref:Uncharacterized protein n=1 Tax=Legionella cincinnatiensis TaxID=28085 RepID=A0A378IM59_9GAMM|nr:Uncharacterised protein [Legionella cincinnatiensis]
MSWVPIIAAYCYLTYNLSTPLNTLMEDLFDLKLSKLNIRGLNS